MAFTAKILSWRFRHLNIEGCLVKRRPTKGGSRAPQDPPPLATPLKADHFVFRYRKLIMAERQLLTPVKRAEGHFCFCRPTFLIPSRTFSTWAPHGRKMSSCNPNVKQCSALQDPPSARISFSLCKQSLIDLYS